jgi:hypothetical protein
MPSHEVIRLEALRQQLQASKFFAGSLVDYLNHGNPNHQEQEETIAGIEQYEAWARESQRQLHEMLSTLRATAPEVIEEWVQWHMGICNRIIAEGDTAESAQDGLISDSAVRLYVARETLGEWKKVLSGEQDLVLINDYYLSDYSQEILAVVENHPL